MDPRSNPRFDAQEITRLRTVVAQGRLEMHLVDAKGNGMVLTLPLPAAVQFGCLICEAAENAPFLVGNNRVRREQTTDAQ